jgi:hypothetical protein
MNPILFGLGMEVSINSRVITSIGVGLNNNRAGIAMKTRMLLLIKVINKEGLKDNKFDYFLKDFKKVIN